MDKIGLIGFGEVRGIFAKDLASAVAAMALVQAQENPVKIGVLSDQLA